MNALLPQILFFGFAFIAIITAFLVITQNNAVRSVLFLVVTFFAMAVLWLLMNAEFLALILILVYVGAVMTLFLFVVMMLNIDTETLKGHLVRTLPIGFLLIVLLTALMINALPENFFSQNILANAPVTTDIQAANTERIGLILYTDYFFAFEAAGVMLLVAIVAAITLTNRALTRSKKQDIMKQLLTTKAQRLQIVKLKPKDN